MNEFKSLEKEGKRLYTRAEAAEAQVKKLGEEVACLREDYDMAAGLSLEFEKRAKAAEAKLKARLLTERGDYQLYHVQNSGIFDEDVSLEPSDYIVVKKDALAEARKLFINSCHKFCGDGIEEPNETDCFECESYPVFKALGAGGSVKREDSIPVNFTMEEGDEK